jgi:hypothetical protein
MDAGHRLSGDHVRCPFGGCCALLRERLAPTGVFWRLRLRDDLIQKGQRLAQGHFANPATQNPVDFTAPRCVNGTSCETSCSGHR